MCVVCNVVKLHFPHDPSRPPGTVGTLLICVVIGVNIVSFFILKVCFLPPNTMGFLPLLLRVILLQHCWFETVQVSVVDGMKCLLASFKGLIDEIVCLYFNFRYDEWIKADKIVRPANKNVPKIKHRKKIKVRFQKVVKF